MTRTPPSDEEKVAIAAVVEEAIETVESTLDEESQLQPVELCGADVFSCFLDDGEDVIGDEPAASETLGEDKEVPVARDQSTKDGR